MILLIGYGFWGKNLARNFGSSLSAVYDLDYIRAEECKKLYPWIRAYEGEDNLEEILKNPIFKSEFLLYWGHTTKNLNFKSEKIGIFRISSRNGRNHQ